MKSDFETYPCLDRRGLVHDCEVIKASYWTCYVIFMTLPLIL